jgi:hypothetical protein
MGGYLASVLPAAGRFAVGRVVDSSLRSRCRRPFVHGDRFTAVFRHRFFFSSDLGAPELR